MDPDKAHEEYFKILEDIKAHAQPSPQTIEMISDVRNDIKFVREEIKSFSARVENKLSIKHALVVLSVIGLCLSIGLAILIYTTVKIEILSKTSKELLSVLESSEIIYE